MTRGEVWVRLEVESLPLADGRFDVAVSLADGTGGHVYHRRLAAASFVVYSAKQDDLGIVRLDGRWSLGR